MTYAVLQHRALDLAAGALLQNVDIRVRREVPGLPTVQLYADAAGETSIGNPTNGGYFADGKIRAYARGGFYRVELLVDGVVVDTFYDVACGTAAGTDTAGGNVNVKDFGAAGDGVYLADGAITATTTGFTSASAAFTANDVGKLIRIAGAGAAGAVLETSIAAYVGAGAVTTADAAGTTVSDAITVYGSDDTEEIQNAVDAVAGSLMNSSVLVFPAGIYLTTSEISISAFCHIIGDGASFINWTGSILQPSVTTSGFEIVGQYAVDIFDLGIFYPDAADSGTAAVYVSPTDTSAFCYYSKFKNLTVNNAYDVFYLDRAIWTVVDSIAAQGYAHVGVTVQNANGIGDDGANTVVNSTFIGGSGAVSSLYWTSGGALTWSGNRSLSSDYAVYINPRTGLDTSQIIITNNQIDGIDTAGVYIVRQGATGTLEEIIIANNTFNLAERCVYVPTDANGVGIYTMVIADNVVRGKNSVSARFFDIDSVSGVSIADNTMESNNASTLGINIGSAAANAMVGANTFSGTFGVDWQNASSSFEIANAITTNLGGIVYSAADRLAVLSGTATSGQMLRSGNVAAPTWSTATWPSTVTSGRILYASSDNVVGEFAPAAGIITWLQSPTSANLRAALTDETGTGAAVFASNPTFQGATIINGAAGTFRTVTYTTGNVNRWLMFTDNGAEGGSNAGSDWGINAYDDSGNYLSTPFQITRSTGKVNFTAAIDSTSAATGAVTTSGGIGAARAIYSGQEVCTGVYTVATLPTANAARKGARAFVTDANATTFMSTVAAGGANNVPVFCDGTNWKIG